jgi:hypothetical protein
MTTSEKTPTAMTPRIAGEVRADMITIERIIESGVLESDPKSPFLEDSFTRLMICLRDLLVKSSEYANKHVNFNDDIIRSPVGARKRIRNISHLVEFMRDAVSHPHIDNHMLTDRVSHSFGRVQGRNFPLIRVGGVSLDPPFDYDDDIVFTFGYQRIYLKRHIIRAFEEAKNNLVPLVDP